MRNRHIKKLVIAFAWLYAAGLHSQVMFAQNDVLKHIENSTPLPYIAIKGDTLIGLSDRYLSGNKYWKVLKKINAIDDPYRIPIGTVIKMPPDLLRSVSISAMLAGAWGLVRWRSGSADWKVASIGDTLSQGDEIEVNAASSAVIEFPNGTRINLHAGTKLKFDALLQYPAGQMTDARLNLKHGHIEINDNPHQIEQQNLRVTTPGAQAIVRGTNFRVTVSGAETREETLQGLIELFADGKSILVPNSQGAVVTGNKLPDSIQKLLEPPNLSDVKVEYQQSDISIKIDDANGVKSFAGQISNDARFDAITAESKSNSDGVLKFVEIVDGSYYLRVRALDEYSLQGKDAIRIFKVKSKPANSTSWQPIYPVNLQVVRDRLPKVEWSGPSVNGCRIQMSKDAEFERPFIERFVLENKIIMDMDLSLGSWYWRIICDPSADHAQIQSNVWSFAIRPTLDIGKLGMPELKLDSSNLYVELPKTPHGAHFRVGYTKKDSGESVAEFKSATGGRVSWPRPPKGNYAVVSYLEDDETNEKGKWVSQEINIPTNAASEFLYFLPLLLML